MGYKVEIKGSGLSCRRGFEYPIKNIGDIHKYDFPDLCDRSRFRKIKSISNNTEEYNLVLNWVFLFEKLHFLHGFNSILIDLMLNKNKIEFLLYKIVNFNIDIIRILSRDFKNIVHGFKSTDDWGTQDGLIIRPSLWREIFKTRYKKIMDEVHKIDLDFWLHSDDNIEQTIPDLIEIGVEVLEIPQPKLFNLEEL